VIHLEGVGNFSQCYHGARGLAVRVEEVDECGEGLVPRELDPRDAWLNAARAVLSAAEASFLLRNFRRGSGGGGGGGGGRRVGGGVGGVATAVFWHDCFFAWRLGVFL